MRLAAGALMLWTIALVALTLLVGKALAQAPPHAPGSVCYTAQIWCWAQPPGRPGAPCVCRTPAGPVRGQLG